MTSLVKAALIGLALCATSIQAYAQTPNKDKRSEIRKQMAQTPNCPSLQEAGAILKLMDESDALERLIQEAKSTRDRVCADKADAAGTVLRDLMLATIRQDEAEVCKIATNPQNQELVIKMIQVAYSYGGLTPCKIMTR